MDPPLKQPLAEATRRVRQPSVFEVSVGAAAITAATLMLIAGCGWRLGLVDRHQLLLAIIGALGLGLALSVMGAIVRGQREDAEWMANAPADRIADLTERLAKALPYMRVYHQPSPFMRSALTESIAAARAIDARRDYLLVRRRGMGATTLVVGLVFLSVLLRFGHLSRPPVRVQSVVLSVGLPRQK